MPYGRSLIMNDRRPDDRALSGDGSMSLFRQAFHRAKTWAYFFIKS